MAENKTKDPAADFTVDEIIAAYKDGDINAKQKNDMLRRKAQANLSEQVAEAGLTGLPMLMLKKTIEEAQEGWNEFVSEVGRVKPDEGESIGLKLKAGGSTVLAGIKMASSLFTAIGEVSGQQAENTALKLGASPGWAKAINVAVDVGSGFVPVGLGAKTVAHGVQGLAKLGKVGAKAPAAAAGKAADLGNDAARISQQVLEEGLKADGVKTAEVVSKHITGLERTIREAVEGTAKVTAKPAAKAVEKAGKTQFTEKFLEYKKEMAGITETKTHEMTLKEAEKLGLNLDDLRNLAPGTALKESEMAAYLKALDEPVDELVTLAKAAVKGGTDEAQVFANKAMEFFQYSPKFRAAEVTAGRSVEILKESPPMKSITDMLMGWDVENMAKGDFSAAMRTMAENIVGMADEPNKLKSLQVQGGTHWQRFKENGWPMVREAYTNLLLARPLTQVRNFAGNQVAAINSLAERQVAGWLSIDPKGVARGEGVMQFQGMMASLGDGLKAFGKAFTTLSPEEATKFDFMPHKIPGVIGQIINIPGDMMRGFDNFQKTILQRGDMYAMAYRNATQMGLKGDDLAKYVAERSWNPTTSMVEHAKDFALSGTFQDDLGALGKAAQKLQTGPLALLFPFMKTPINLAKYAWNHTPGLQMLSHSLYSDITAGGARADMAIARLTLSNLTGMFVYGLAQEGLITGGGPTDLGLKRSWELTKHPYSIAGKDGWHPYSNFDPATTPIALMADFAEVMNQMDDPNAEQMAAALMLGGVRDIADKSWWQTIGKLIDVTTDFRSGEGFDSSKAMKLIASPFTTVASGGPLGQAVTRAIENDPIRKDVRGILDDYRSKIPGFGSMPPMRDGLGEPVLVPQALGGSWVAIGSPILEKPFNEDRVAKEASRLQIRMPKWPNSIGGKQQSDFDVNELQPGDSLPVGLSAQEKDRWGEIHKQLLRNPESGIEKLLDSEEYQAQPQAGQRAIFTQALSGYRSTAMQILETENGGDLMKRKIDATAGKYLPMTPADQRPEVEQAFKDAKSEVDVIAPEAQDNLMRWGILE